MSFRIAPIGRTHDSASAGSTSPWISGVRVSTVVVQRVPADRVQRFLECQRGLTEAAKGFPGYQSTELYPPADDQPVRSGWRSSTSTTSESLQRWLDSPVRAEWIKKLRDEIGDFRLKTLPTGFRRLVCRAGHRAGRRAAPSWKIAMTVLLGLYPTVMLLATCRRAIPESPGNGRVDAGQQHAQRGHRPSGS